MNDYSVIKKIELGTYMCIYTYTHRHTYACTHTHILVWRTVYDRLNGKSKLKSNANKK